MHVDVTFSHESLAGGRSGVVAVATTARPQQRTKTRWQWRGIGDALLSLKPLIAKVVSEQAGFTGLLCLSSSSILEFAELRLAVSLLMERQLCSPLFPSRSHFLLFVSVVFSFLLPRHVLVASSTTRLAAASEGVVAVGRCLPTLEGDDHGDHADEQGLSLMIYHDPWLTSTLIANLAAILLREELNFNVTMVSRPPGLMSKEVYEYVAKENADLAFEVWPIGKANERAIWTGTEEGKASVAEYETFKSRSGMYATYGDGRLLLDEMLATVEGVARLTRKTPLIADPAAVALCNDGTTRLRDRCDTDGIWRSSSCKQVGPNCTVQIIAQDPTWADPELSDYEALGVPIQVVYLMDTWKEYVWRAKQTGAEQLFSWYYPAAKIKQYDTKSFPRVELVRDQPRYLMQKLTSPKLGDEKYIDAKDFAARFLINNDDVDRLVELYDTETIAGEPVHRAACTWVKQNREIWEGYIAHTSRLTVPLTVCGKKGPCNASCWTTFFVQLFLGVALYIVGSFEMPCGCFEHLCRKVCGKRSEVRPTLTRRNSVIPATSKEVSANVIAQRKFRRAVRNAPNFLGHKRTLQNFSRRNTDSQLVLPPDGPASRWIADLSRQTLYTYLICSDRLNDFVQVSLGLALISGALGTLIWLMLDFQKWQMPYLEKVPLTKTIEQTDTALDSLASGMKFFPIFLMIGYLSYANNRWNNFVRMCYSIQGRIHDVAVICGGAALDGGQPQTRAILFRIYRYLNLTHFLAFQKRNIWLAEASLDDLIEIGLLTEAEKRILEPAKRKKCDLVLAWISDTISEASERELFNQHFMSEAIVNVAGARSKIAGFQDMFTIKEPNVWTALMTFVVDALILVYVIGTPFMAFTEIKGVECFQLWSLLSTFFLCFPLVCATSIVKLLDYPFPTGRTEKMHKIFDHDVFNVGATMASTEQTIFQSLRTSFDDHTRKAAAAAAEDEETQDLTRRVGTASSLTDSGEMKKGSAARVGRRGSPSPTGRGGKLPPL